MASKQVAKIKRIDLEADIHSPCKGLAERLSTAILAYSDVNEINDFKLQHGDQTVFETAISPDSMTVGDDGTDAYIEFKVTDFSSSTYEFDTVYVMALGWMNIWGRNYFKWTGSWSKSELEYLEIVIKLWIRGLSGS